jgi:hypothetical protein
MNCEQYRELLMLQVCGEIDSEQESQLHQHLDQCSDCTREQKEFRAMLGLLRQLPDKEWNEKLKIRDLLRRDQRWRTIVFSKAALWLIVLTAFITVIANLPVRWELSAQGFSVRWGHQSPRETELNAQLQKLQLQLSTMQKQNQEMYQVSESRLKQMLDQNNAEQQKRYWETLEMVSGYLQLQRKTDLQKIQHEIASTYDRTGHEVEKTNELLEYVLRASTPAENSGYDSN